MIHKGRVIGVLDLESPQLNYFTADHVQALSILAAQLAVSLENARLYEKVARDEARMERESARRAAHAGRAAPGARPGDYGLDIAARILSAREVCGDIYDFLRYGPRELGFAWATSAAKARRRALRRRGHRHIAQPGAAEVRPAEMLRHMNQLMCERRIEGRFMTMCFATWTRHTQAAHRQRRPRRSRCSTQRRMRKNRTGGLSAGHLRRCHLRRNGHDPRSRRHSSLPFRRHHRHPKFRQRILRHRAHRRFPMRPRPRTSRRHSRSSARTGRDYSPALNKPSTTAR